MSFVSKFKKISYSDIMKKFHHPQNSQLSVKRSLASISTEKSSITFSISEHLSDGFLGWSATAPLTFRAIE